MYAKVGDRLIVHSTHIGELVRDAEILETAAGGQPPYLVRWGDTGHEGLVYPGPDAEIQHFDEAPEGRTARS